MLLVLTKRKADSGDKIAAAGCNNTSNLKDGIERFDMTSRRSCWYRWFSPDATAAMLVYRTIEKKVFWEFDSFIMQNMSHDLLLFCAPTWPSRHVIENHLFQNKGKVAIMVYQTSPPGIELYFFANTFFCFSKPIWLLVT